jgi:hypothetical protein
VVRVTYDLIATRGQISKRSAKLLLDALERAEVLRYERRNDRATGAIVSLLHLLVQDGAWMPITVAMADHLAAPRPAGHLLRDLGLVVVLLEFCAEQRHEHGGLAAEVMRADIAARSGLTVDRVDDCNHALERAGILEITRRRADNGGRYLPSFYTIAEAPSAPLQGGGLEPGTRQNGTAMAAGRYLQGGESVLPTWQNGTGKAEDGYSQRGDSATAGTASPPSIAHGGESHVQEQDVENIPRSKAQRGYRRAEGGGEEHFTSRKGLCEALLAAWVPALGDVPRLEYEAHRDRWLAAAARVLDRHSSERLAGALAYMVTDEILGSQALTMTGFAKVVDQLIARHYVRQRRLAAGLATPSGQIEALGWEDAKRQLQRAIQRHGRDGRASAVAELGANSELLVRFIERVRWTTLCEEPLQYAERRYAAVWAELVREDNQTHRGTSA